MKGGKLLKAWRFHGLQKEPEGHTWMKEWQKSSGDAINLTSPTLLPLEYDFRKLVRKPDSWQPEYTRIKYFESDSLTLLRLH